MGPSRATWQGTGVSCKRLKSGSASAPTAFARLHRTDRLQANPWRSPSRLLESRVSSYRVLPSHNLSPAGGIEAFAAPILQSELGFSPAIAPVVDRAASIRAFRHVGPPLAGQRTGTPAASQIASQSEDSDRYRRGRWRGKTYSKWVVAPGGLEPPTRGLGPPRPELKSGLKGP